MRKAVTIIAVIAFIACTVLYAAYFESTPNSKETALRPGNQAIPGIEPFIPKEQTDNSEAAETFLLTPEASHAFQDAIAGVEGITYTPEALLGSRIVADNAGTDYEILCFVQEKGSDPYYAVLTIFEYPDGEARIVTVKKQETHSSSEVMAFGEKKDIDDYDMADILMNPELIEEYKKVHPYLDDMNYFPIENPRLVQEIGYSRIWNVLEVRTVGSNGGEEAILFENVPHELFENFRDTEDVDEYFNTVILPLELDGRDAFPKG